MSSPRDLETAVSEPAGPQLRRATDCVADDDFVALSAGKLSPERIEAILAHVDTCRACGDVMATLGRLESTTRTVGRYELGRVLGAGAMGIVYAAWDPQLQRRVALKVVRPERADAVARERMLREARALARISHPNVVAVYDVSEHRGMLCIATELVDGETLVTWQRRQTVEQRVDAWIQAARGLAAAHAGGIVHRDVKPANVFIGQDGRVRVGDFGIARAGGAASEQSGERAIATPPAVATDRVTETGLIAGTPAYMAPEQARGDIDARSDQFAVCVALAEAITGTRPAAGTKRVVPERPLLDAALVRGLAEDPAARFPSIDELADALAAAIAPPRRRTRAIAITASVVALAGAAIAWLAWPRADRCELPAVPAALWSPARRAEVAKHVPASVLPRVDGWLASWSDARANVCAIERDNPALRARRERCELGQLGELDRMLSQWEHTDSVAAMIAHQAFEELPRTGRCSHEAQLHVPDPTAAQWVRIAAVQLGIQRARDPACDCAIPRLSALFADAREIGYPPLVVEVATALASYQDHDAAVRTLREAIAAADAAGAELPAIDARIALLAISDDHPPADIDEIADTARSLIAKIGGNAELDARVEYAVNLIEGSRGHEDAALAAAQRGRRAAQLAYGPDSGHEVIALIQIFVASEDHDPKTAQTARDTAIAINRRAGLGLPVQGAATIGGDPDGFLDNMQQLFEISRREYPDSTGQVAAELDLAKAYFIAGKLAPAVPYFEESLALGERLGVHDKNLLYGYIIYCRTLRGLDRGGEAVSPARKAVMLAEQLQLDDGLGDALVERARTRLETDRRAAIGDLQRARIALERGRAGTISRASADFLLATATYPDGHAAARSLAIAARADVQRMIDALAPDDPSADRTRTAQKSKIADIEAWLAAHP